VRTDDSPILVTGARGGIGREVVNQLHNAGRAVIPLTRDGSPLHDLATIAYDITDHERAADLLATHRPRAVLHLAGLTGGASASQPDEAMRVNTVATAALAQACADAGVPRLVFASSAAVYGDGGTTPFTENAALRGQSAYAVSKREAEVLLQEVSREDGLSVVAFRIFNVYGDGLAESLIARILESTASRPAVLRGGESFVRDYVHVSDVARALIGAVSLEVPTPFSVINLGTGVGTSNADLHAVFASRKDIHLVSEPGRPSFSVANTTVMERLLGFTPTPIGQRLAH
jgi:UDP-glucose 4-epimerase